MVRKLVFSIFILFISIVCNGQQPPTMTYDSLQRQILALDAKVSNIELNLDQSKKKFKSGILIATLGYTTTIAGGLMLGRANDEAGQALLLVGGTTGIIGTYKMVDAFNYLTGKKKRIK